MRNRKLGGFKFRRQYPFASYVLDVFCEEANLAVEADGVTHDTASAWEYDRKRDLCVTRCGIRVLRFQDNELMKCLEGVLELILEVALERSGSMKR